MPSPPTPVDNRDPMRRFFDSCLDLGVNVFNAEEQKWLCSYIDKDKADHRELVYRIAKQVLWDNRTHALTYKLVQWIYHNDTNHALVTELLQERLSEMDFEWGDMMSLEELDELMDCQTVIDTCKKELELQKQELKKQMQQENETEQEEDQQDVPMV